MCADPGARTPIAASKTAITFIPKIGKFAMVSKPIDLG